MGKRGHTEEEILRVLREAEAGVDSGRVVPQHGISQQSFYLWEEEVCGSRTERAPGTAPVARREQQAKAAGGRPQPTIGTSCRRSSQKSSEASHASRAGEVGSTSSRSEPAARGGADSCRPCDSPLGTSSRSAGCIASGIAGVERQPGAIRIPQINRDAETGRLERERQVHLPPLHRGRNDHAHSHTKAESAAAPSRPGPGQRHQPEMEHGFRGTTAG